MVAVVAQPHQALSVSSDDCREGEMILKNSVDGV